MESKVDEEKRAGPDERTNDDQSTIETSEITLKTVKTSDKVNSSSSSEITSVTKTEENGEVAQITLSTIHNIYKSNLDSTVSDTKEILLTRNNSTRKLSKAAYAKLHRKSSNPTHVGLLKSKYELSSTKKTDDVNVSKDNVDNTKANANVKNVEENPLNNAKESAGVDLKAKDTSDKKPAVSQPSESIEQTTSNIEKLQRNLTIKLSKETVEKLRNKYSPASFGYPKTFATPAKRVQFSTETSTTTKIPIPKPRVSVKPKELIAKQLVVTQTDATKLVITTKPDDIIKVDTTKLDIIKADTTKFDTTKFDTSKKVDTTKFDTTKKVDTTNKVDTTKADITKVGTTKPNTIKFDTTKPDTTTKSIISKSDDTKSDTTKSVAQKRVEPLVTQATIQVTTVIPEKPEQIYASTSTLTSILDDSQKDENSNDINAKNNLDTQYDAIVFGDPQDQNLIIRRSSSEDSVTKVEKFFSDITMEKKPKEKKRSNSFRRMLSGSFFGNSKKKADEDKKKNKKIENAVFSDNAQNESNAFQRNASQRHTINNYPSRESVPKRSAYTNGSSDDKNLELEMRYAERHINRFNQLKYNFSSANESQCKYPQEDYICMDSNDKKPASYMNVPKINKYIDTSSSSSTIESEKPSNTYENALIAQAELQYRQNSKLPLPNLSRSNKLDFTNAPERFSETPPRAHDTYQNLQLVKPKALIPISSERPLPNPYHNGDQSTIKDQNRSINAKSPQLDDVYGTVFDSIETRRNRSLSPQAHSIPRSPSLESTKLKLPPNRERIELQPRIKSPIPQAKVSTDKIIATELLKNARSPTPTRKNVRTSPSHQRLEIDIDYPDKVDHVSNHANRNDGLQSKPPLSPKKAIEQNIEAAEWQKRQKEIDQYPFVPGQQQSGGQQIVTNALVHNKPPVQHTVPKSPPNLAQQSRIPVSPIQYQTPSERSVTPVNQRTLPSPTLSPEKLEMRQSVEAWHWKELKKLKQQKEREEQELYYYQIQLSPYGYAEDPVFSRRSRSVSPGMQRGGGRRSLSLPRDVRAQKVPNTYPSPENAEAFARLRQPEPIPEGRAVMSPNLVRAQQPTPTDYYYYGQINPNFLRNASQRRTIGPIGAQDYNQRPIFKRGSLTQPQPEPLYQANKKVSFPGHQNNQPVWPTRNGFTQSPPQRRIDKRDSVLEDDVFLPNSPRTPVVAPKRELVISNESPYGYMRPADQPTKQMNSPVGYNPQEQHVVLRKQLNTESVNESPYGSARQINNNYRQQMIQQSPVYYSRQTIPDGPPQSRKITVTDRVCDIYGQIHDNSAPGYGQLQKSGVVYGQLQKNPTPGSPVVFRQNVPNCFVRGSRLTASANDMYKRYTPIDPRYRSDTVVFEPIYEQRFRYEGPNRPLPPVPSERSSSLLRKNRFVPASDTESDTSEIQRLFRADMNFQNRNMNEEEWNSDGKSGRGIVGNESGGGRGDNDGEVRGRSSRSARRDDPRRHTLGGDQQYSMSGQGGPLARTMDLEGQPRGYPPPSNAMLFDDDPGIMSEVETSSTGFRRGGKQRSSLPVVRTPSKTLERPLGLVFLQYRNETKRALLPNEITSIDTVKALFVRSFPKQLTMEYLDSPQVKIYIHDSSKDMFYELEDLRSHLREIRDRSVLRLFESADVSGGLPMAGIGIAGGVGHFEDPSYFSEPEFDSEYQHQHIHKSKGSAGKAAPYYMGSTASLPRGATLLRTYSPAVGALPADRIKTLPTGAPPKPQRAYSGGAPRSSDGPPRPPDRFAPFQRPTNSLFNLPDGYMSSPERGSRAYEDPYYSQYASRSGSITPVIDEEVSDTELLDDSYSLYGVKLPPGGPRATPRSPFPPPTAVPYDATRLRVENMERQLANLTGLVQKALTQPSTHLQVPSGRDNYRTGDEFDKNSSSSSASLPDETYLRSDSKTPKLGKSSCHKSVSFEKSVSFSDEPPDMNSPKQHSPQHTADTKPPKPAIKSSTLPRTSSQERDRLKPAPPPKPASLSPGQYDGRHIYRDLQLTPEMYNQLRGLQKKAKDLRAEVRNLRRMSQAQAHSVRETIRDTFIKIRAMLLAGGEQVWQAGMDQEHVRLSREEDLYKQEMLRLEKDLSDLESTVEELRGNVINRKTRVNMSDVENMALVLSKSSKTVADLKLRFPGLQDGMKAFLSSEMEKVVREEKFLKEEPERLESALRRCKKLTGTLVTLKRLASVQEQRLPCSTATNDGRLSPNLTETPPVTPTSAQQSKSSSGASRLGQIIIGGDSTNSTDSSQRPENALDALLDELQTFSKPHPTTVSTQMPQVSYPDCTPSDPPAIPVKGIPPSHSSHFNHPPLMSEIGRKGSMDSSSLLATQNLTVSTATGSLRRLHSYPSGSDTDNSPPIQPLQRIQVDSNKTSSKPPLPERNAELLQHITSGRRVPPPPPPRTSSKSPLASPTSPSLPPRSPATGLQHIQNVQNMVDKPQSQFEAATQNLGLSTLRRNVPGRSSIKDKAQTLPRNIGSNLQIHTEGDVISASNSSSCESVNSQDGSKKSTRKEELEQRHQELLKKQKALQEQYARLQQLQRGNNTLAVVPPAPDQLLKKTGSESNLLQKMGLQMATTQMTGSLTHLPNTSSNSKNIVTNTNTPQINAEEQTANNNAGNVSTTTNKVYETDIL